MLSAHYQPITSKLFSSPRASRHGKRPQKEASFAKTIPLFPAKSMPSAHPICPLGKAIQSPPWGAKPGSPNGHHPTIVRRGLTATSPRPPRGFILTFPMLRPPSGGRAKIGRSYGGASPSRFSFLETLDFNISKARAEAKPALIMPSAGNVGKANISKARAEAKFTLIMPSAGNVGKADIILVTTRAMPKV